MKTRKVWNSNRSYDQVKAHYLIEKEIAGRLKKADREERKQIYSLMYNELFSKVPDHPRITRRENYELSRKAINKKLNFVISHLNKFATFLEFAPGDCKFALEITKHVKNVYAVDISDQKNKNDILPNNFYQIIYDGYDLKEIKDNSIDIVFSDDLIEHLHPDDTIHHFELVNRILKKGGKYIFCTPHLFTGPHDVSGYFSNEPEGFHLKEWTYAELKKLLKSFNFSEFYAFIDDKFQPKKVNYFYLEAMENILRLFPNTYDYRYRLSKIFIPEIKIVVIK